MFTRDKWVKERESTNTKRERVLKLDKRESFEVFEFLDDCLQEHKY